MSVIFLGGPNPSAILNRLGCEGRAQQREPKTPRRLEWISMDIEMSECHRVVSNTDWLKARVDLLAKEKEFTKLRDELSQARKAR